MGSTFSSWGEEGEIFLNKGEYSGYSAGATAAARLERKREKTCFWESTNIRLTQRGAWRYRQSSDRRWTVVQS